MADKVIRKGEMVVVSEGAYSSYTLVSLCRAKEDIHWRGLRDEYLALYPEERSSYQFKHGKFFGWLVNEKNLLEEVPYQEFYLGTYGESDEMDVWMKEDGEV